MTRSKIEQLEFDKKLESFYDIKGKKYLCRKCNQNIKTNRESHYSSCIGIGTQRQIKKSKTLNNEYHSKICDLGCGQQSSFFYKTGKAYCSKFGNSCPVKIKNDSDKKIRINLFEGKVHSRPMLGIEPWNKGMTKENSTKIANYSKKISSSLIDYKRLNPHIHTPETKAKLSAAAFRRKIGGYQKGSGWGKKGWYKGYFCDSSWELAYVIYSLDHHIPIKRNLESRQYIWEGKLRKYIPDFIMNNDPNDIVEIKGYSSPQSLAKMEANPDIKVLYGDDLKHVFKYVKEKYGKNFISLYEKVEK